jgi:diguanylate cyclase (GGDEF)-like protein
VLLWQGRIRVVVAVIAGVAALVLQQAGVLPGSSALLFAVMSAYTGSIGVLCYATKRIGGAGNLLVAATVLSDLVFIFSSTIASSSVGHYDRILILSFFVLHFTESYFGRAHATLALVAVISCYVATIATVMQHGAALLWGDELWSVALFAIAAVVFILQYGSFQQRLGRIIDLFEAAEEGDFAESYDVNADTTPDAITSVGRAYNRVRVQLASMVLTDPLTGALNRRGLDQALAREVSRSRRAGSELSVLALDLDHFKNVNDTHGHIVGDVVLRELGLRLGQTARGGDMVARTGGEEFTVLLPDTDPLGAYRAAVRMCETIRSRAFVVDGNAINLTVSVGVASASGDHADAARNLKQRADEALYAAKRSGRDRVRVWDEELKGISVFLVEAKLEPKLPRASGSRRAASVI